MIDLFKDRYKLSLLMAALFLVGIMASIYQIYRLPYNLMISDGHPALFNVYLVPGITFLIGAFTVWHALTYKNEVVVFRDKQTDTTDADGNRSDTDKATISLDNVKDSLRQGGTEKTIIQAGLHAICKQLDAGQGAVYTLKEEEGKRTFELKAGYALAIAESTVISYEIGEGLIGQAGASGKTLYVDDIPEGYVKIISGLGSASPRYLLIVSLKKQEQVTGVMEIASFSPLNEHQRKFVEDSAQLIADRVSGK
ncbi:GAF domain-containing protein [Fulvivirgaceae bacterium PWU4]|uniref:GAF domain-containing protein n=1 Tax=Chryseosolibacter histidini TaxID=2782349 RepID=A0AAP2DH74_9BACT|nr:GAF domain-containing protein [Chryseosolibacter histidini]MBT1696318.1 GAF domain-containing protein [Chryseosolibacter histidini]